MGIDTNKNKHIIKKAIKNENINRRLSTCKQILSNEKALEKKAKVKMLMKAGIIKVVLCSIILLLFSLDSLLSLKR
ncbi:MAG: hypothetical protein ABIA04_10015 [Pseudomonadota bacterium]